MGKLDVMYSSQTDNWATPMEFFEELDKEFRFNLDPCASEQNHKCERYFTKEQNGLLQDWGGVASLLQSALRQSHRRLGPEGIRGRAQREHARGHAHPGQNGHTIFSQLHQTQGGGSLRRGAAEVRRSKTGSPVPIHGGDLQGPRDVKD